MLGAAARKREHERYDLVRRVTAEALCDEAGFSLRRRGSARARSARTVRTMQRGPAMNSTNKTINKVMKNVWKAMPELPFVARKSSPVLSYVLGAIGVAIATGIAAVMVLSPRTRYRAIDVAKGAYGKASDKLGQTRVGHKLGLHPETPPLSNGLSAEFGTTSNYGAGGL
jgi:hypothetical protein